MNMRIKFKIISIILFVLLLILIFPLSKATRTNCENNNIEYNYTRIYFVIGFGIYIYGGTWPMYDEVCPIFLIRFGRSGLDILRTYSGKCIDFMEGDKLIGYYPFLNPIGIGFVCGIWIDVES
jgi:hypothetical protein